MYTIRNVVVYLSSEIVVLYFSVVVSHLWLCFVFAENFSTNDVRFLVRIARINVPTVLLLVLLTKVNTAVMLVVKCTRVLHIFFQVCLRDLL